MDKMSIPDLKKTLYTKLREKAAREQLSQDEAVLLWTLSLDPIVTFGYTRTEETKPMAEHFKVKGFTGGGN